ncbi:tetratricopeptide repeat protein [Dysgonomonas alginatilytica]|uniref:Tetratricopeptide repeat protein n=1 Tax=Dysgonomonas alginatilytica TaxID=1605892 RepID=A0A2V3Q0A2_9BACT|nr:tetratricopeptide repeat protein [Dysgonomonas alginatilytica]PXV68205.1 tetratricopeptide repeat protein [Dysgonomonas alginatilytica]
MTVYKYYSVLVLLFVSLSINAANDKEAIYNAFITGNMAEWKTIITDIESRKLTSVSDKLELINYYYGYIGYSLGIKNKKEAATYVDKMQAILDELTQSNPNTADVYAYKAALVGFKIGLSPYKAPFIGKSSGENAKKALAIDADNIQGNIEQANVLYYSPSAFGGDKAKAKEYYKKAVSLFENNPTLLKQNWLYLSLLTKIGQIQEEEKDFKSAKQTYDKILTIEPNYSFVKNELLPNLKKKM